MGLQCLMCLHDMYSDVTVHAHSTSKVLSNQLTLFRIKNVIPVLRGSLHFSKEPFLNLSQSTNKAFQILQLLFIH